MRIHAQLAMFWLFVLGLGLALEGCAESSPSGPTFDVSFDSSLARSNGGEPTRVELYLVDDCDSVPMGARSVPALATAEIVRDGSGGAFEEALPLGDFGLYGVALDDDCAVVAAGCTSVTIEEGTGPLAITLSRYDLPGCPAGQFCSRQTGECNAGTGGTGGAGATGGVGGSGDTGRVIDGIVALYEFEEAGGDRVSDSSGVNPTVDLTIDDTRSVTWFDGFLRIDSEVIISSDGPATKVFSSLAPSNATTLEAWVKPSSLVPVGTPPDRIVTMSTSASERNFLLGQDGNVFAARYRTEENNGNPTVYSTVGTATTWLTHVVFTHAADGTEVFYIDGVERGTSTRFGDTNTWDQSFPLVLANEYDGGREWLGELHLVAIYDRALTEEEVQQNFGAGP